MSSLVFKVMLMPESEDSAIASRVTEGDCPNEDKVQNEAFRFEFGYLSPFQPFLTVIAPDAIL